MYKLIRLMAGLPSCDRSDYVMYAIILYALTEGHA